MISYEDVANKVKHIFDNANVIAMAYDPAKFSLFIPWLKKAGLSDDIMDIKFVKMLQTFVSLGPGIDELARLIVTEKLAHGNNPILGNCIYNAKVEKDNQGLARFIKRGSLRRIDGALTLAMCCKLIGGFDVEKNTPKQSYLTKGPLVVLKTRRV